MLTRDMYRGISEQTGKWAYGILIADNMIMPVNQSPVYHQTSGQLNAHIERVKPETLCRCTGRRDRNGKPIFENDVLGIEYPGMTFYAKVIWDINRCGYALIDLGQPDQKPVGMFNVTEQIYVAGIDIRKKEETLCTQKQN